MTVDGSFTNSGTLDVDNIDEEGGSELTISDTLDNTGAVQIGNGRYPTAATTLTLGGLTNSASTDSFSLTGSASYAATLVFSTGGAGFTSNGGAFELTYASPLTLTATFTNSGTFGMHNYASVTVDGGSRTAGRWTSTSNDEEGGSELTISDTLDNTGAVQIGNGWYPTAATTLTLGGLTNSASTDSFSLDRLGEPTRRRWSSALAGPASPCNGGAFELDLCLAAHAERQLHQQRHVRAAQHHGESVIRPTGRVHEQRDAGRRQQRRRRWQRAYDFRHAGQHRRGPIGNGWYPTAATTLTLGGLTNASDATFTRMDRRATRPPSHQGHRHQCRHFGHRRLSIFDITNGGAFTQSGGTTTINANAQFSAAAFTQTGGTTTANGLFSATTINVDGGSFVVDTTDFDVSDTGTLAVADGGTINLSAGGLSNLSTSGVLTGGTYKVSGRLDPAASQQFADRHRRRRHHSERQGLDDRGRHERRRESLDFTLANDQQRGAAASSGLDWSKLHQCSRIHQRR